LAQLNKPLLARMGVITHPSRSNGMKTKKNRRRSQGTNQSLVASLREFLTPEAWKQAQSQRVVSRSSRWKTQPLVLVLLFMTWSCGDSQAERFETARGFCVVCLPRRRRPGRTVQGYQKALAKLPLAVLRSLGVSVRQTWIRRLQQRCYEGSFIPIGCDGSRVECPRTPQLEQRLGQSSKKLAAPTIWVTVLVHLRLGVPWAWRIGRGIASERAHLSQLLPCLPAAALLVADAGYVGYALAKRLLETKTWFLIRLSSNATLYTQNLVRLERFRSGVVYYWPQRVENGAGEPLRLRLIRVRARKRKHDLWLLTNVFDERLLSVGMAARFYRWRWESEGQFRAFKRTLSKTKLVSRTLRLVHREAEGSLLAMQLMLAQGALAMPARREVSNERVCSPRKILVLIRQEMQGFPARPLPSYAQRLQDAFRERRPRSSAKQTRFWPRRKPHRPPKPPNILTLSATQKARIARQRQTTA
jgi:hypothetical protein